MIEPQIKKYCKQKIHNERFVQFQLWQLWQPKKGRFNNETEYAAELKIICEAEVTWFYSTMSEAKAAFAKLTTGSLKNILYRYSEGYRYRYIPKFSQFAKFLISLKIALYTWYQRKAGIPTLSFLYNKPLRKNGKHTV